MVDKVAADLCFRASKVRWLLPEKYFDSAASSAAGLLLDDNINNLRPNRTAKQIVRQKGDKNTLGRSRNLSIYYRGAEYSAFWIFCIYILRFRSVK